MQTLIDRPSRTSPAAEQPGLLLTDENEYSVELADWATRVATPPEKWVKRRLLDNLHLRPRRAQHLFNWVTRQLLGFAHPFGCPCLVVLAGARVAFPKINVNERFGCLLTFGAGLPELSRGGLELSVAFREEGGESTTPLFHERVVRLDVANPRLERTIDLAPLAGRRGQFIIACDPGRAGDGRRDCLALYEFVVGPTDELPLRRARAFAAFREQNELAVFSATYDHAMYNGDSRPSGIRSRLRGMSLSLRGAIRAASSRVRTQKRDKAVEAAVPPRASAPAEKPSHDAPQTPIPAVVKQNLGGYYTTLLRRRLGIGTIDFRRYLACKLKTHADRPIRILSLASGAARIEEGFMNGVDPERIELTLTDINPDLLARAKERLAGKARVRCEVMNLNRLQLPSRRYDIIVCVSALHHVVELERVIGQSAAALVDGGEFWSVGEFVGRNGTRLYDDAYAIANDYFQKLPEKYRVNRNPGSSGATDERLPNLDCSLTCFEGIRSADIEPIMTRHFSPVETINYDCFLWRLFNLAYYDNYDLNQSCDREIIEKAVDLEVEFVRQGGRPTALWGVYRAA